MVWPASFQFSEEQFHLQAIGPKFYGLWQWIYLHITTWSGRRALCSKRDASDWNWEMANVDKCNYQFKFYNNPTYFRPSVLTLHTKIRTSFQKCGSLSWCCYYDRIMNAPGSQGAQRCDIFPEETFSLSEPFFFHCPNGHKKGFHLVRQVAYIRSNVAT